MCNDNTNLSCLNGHCEDELRTLPDRVTTVGSIQKAIVHVGWQTSCVAKVTASVANITPFLIVSKFPECVVFLTINIFSYVMIPIDKIIYLLHTRMTSNINHLLFRNCLNFSYSIKALKSGIRLDLLDPVDFDFDLKSKTSLGPKQSPE